MKPPKYELELVDEFLDKFVYITDDSMSKVQVDVCLMRKAVPEYITEKNLPKIQQLNLTLIQKALIAFQNDDQDELFNYYDHRSKARFNKISKKSNALLNLLNKVETQAVDHVKLQ